MTLQMNGNIFFIKKNNTKKKEKQIMTIKNSLSLTIWTWDFKLFNKVVNTYKFMSKYIIYNVYL